MARPFPRPVRIMGWVSFWADVASEMVYPVIPLFLVGALKAPASALGAMEGIAGVLLNFVRGWSGRWSDKIGRRVPFVQAGYGLTALSKPAMALANSWPLVAAARVTDRFGKGLRNTARDALLADAIDPADAGRAFGYHRAMDAGGAVVGSLIGFVLLLLLPGRYRLIFAVTAIPGVVAWWLTLLLKEARDTGAASQANPGSENTVKAEAERDAAEPAAGADPTPETRNPSPVALSRHFKAVLAVSLLFGLANSSDTFLLLRAKDLGMNDAQVVLSYVLFNLVYSTSAYPLGHLSDRVGRKTVLAFGWLVYGATYLAFAWTPLWGVWGLMGLYGLYNGACDGVSKAWVRDASEPENRGTAMGYYSMGIGFAGLAASLAAGVLWDKVDHRAPFWVGGALAFAAALTLPLVRANTDARSGR